MAISPDPLILFRERAAMVRPLVRGAQERELYDRVLARLDADRLEMLQQKYRDDAIRNIHDRTREFKFLDVSWGLWRMLARIRRLVGCPPRRRSRRNQRWL